MNLKDYEYYKDNHGVLYHGDCLELLKQMPDKSVDLVLTDPPYYKIVNEKWDNQWETEEDYYIWSEKWLKEAVRVLSQNGSFYVWNGIDRIVRYKQILDKLLIYKNLITVKTRKGFGTQKNWMFCREECLFYVKSEEYYFQPQYTKEKRAGNSDKFKSEFTRATNVWHDMRHCYKDSNKRKFHPTEKPVEMIGRILQASSNNYHTKKDLILDPFAGSGTTLRAAKDLGRKYIGVEIEERYCKIAADRLKQEVLF